MKFKISHILLLLLFSVTISAFGQMDRSVGRNQYKRPKTAKTKIDFVEQVTTALTKSLSLDTFQAAAVKNIIEEQRDALNAIGESRDMTDNERNDRMLAIYDKIDSKMLPLLSQDQKEKYKALREKKL